MNSPSQRNIGQDYSAGLQAYLKNLPAALKAEQDARGTYDPQRIQEQLDLEKQFDPQRTAIRTAMGNNVQAGVEAGYKLDPAFNREITQDIRGAQAARGNAYGNAPIAAEAVWKGKNAADMYQRNLVNAGTYLSQPSPSQPDRSAAYTPGFQQAGNLGVQFGQQAYQNQLNSPNPWATGLSIAGTAAAAYFSDENLKEDINETGETTRDGIPIVTFRYRSRPAQLWRGVIAQAVEKVRPDAIGRSHGFKTVNYSALGINMSLA